MGRTIFLPILIILIGTLAGCRDRQPPADQTTDSPSPALTEPSDLPSPPRLAGQELAWEQGGTALLLPEGWQPESGLHDEAQLQAFNPSNDSYAIVLSEPKTDLPDDMTLEQHSDITRDILTGNLSNPQETGPTPVQQVGTDPAIQYRISGTITSIDVTYLHTTVETEHYFNQILTWTSPETFDDREAELQQLIGSFRETAAD